MNCALAVIVIIAACSLNSFAEPPANGNGKDANPPTAAPGGIFVAVGYGGFRGWSEDGENWIGERWSDKNADDPNIICSVTYRDGIFLCSGGGSGRGFILRSTDGKKWTEVVTNKWRIAHVLTLKDRFLSPYDDHFNDSVDGITWTAHAMARPVAADDVGSGYFRRWAKGNDTIVFSGDYIMPDLKNRIGWFGTTRGGLTDIKIQRQPTEPCAIAFGAGIFVAADRAGTVFTSKDGLDFKPTSSVDDKVFDSEGLQFRDGLFYLRCLNGTQTSPDAEHWTKVGHALRIPLATAPDGRGVDVEGGIRFTPDGKTFRKAKVSVDAGYVLDAVYGVPLANLPQKLDKQENPK